MRIVESGSSVCAKYTPSEVGEHLIYVTVNGQSITLDGAPFRSAVFNPRAINVTRVPNGVVGQPVEIESMSNGADSVVLIILAPS